jgi:hypothetical protein
MARSTGVLHSLDLGIPAVSPLVSARRVGPPCATPHPQGLGKALLIDTPARPAAGSAYGDGAGSGTRRGTEWRTTLLA